MMLDIMTFHEWQTHCGLLGGDNILDEEWKDKSNGLWDVLVDDNISPTGVFFFFFFYCEGKL